MSCRCLRSGLMWFQVLAFYCWTCNCSVRLDVCEGFIFCSIFDCHFPFSQHADFHREIVSEMGELGVLGPTIKGKQNHIIFTLSHRI